MEPLLCIGVTFAIFQSFGTVPDVNDKFIRCVSGPDMTLAQSFSMHGGRSSHPAADFRLRDFSSFSTKIRLTYLKPNFWFVAIFSAFGVSHTKSRNLKARFFNETATLVKNSHNALALAVFSSTS